MSKRTAMPATSPAIPPALLTTAQAAAALGFHASYLAKARLSGAGPKYLKIGSRSVRYRRSDIDDWLSDKARVSTSARAKT
jgi:predicted DNA-binding transcriptional regulator AlpA